jgi:hypothetical protein
MLYSIELNVDGNAHKDWGKAFINQAGRPLRYDGFIV